jgi:hypothetical protein
VGDVQEVSVDATLRTVRPDWRRPLGRVVVVNVEADAALRQTARPDSALLGRVVAGLRGENTTGTPVPDGYFRHVDAAPMPHHPG